MNRSNQGDSLQFDIGPHLDEGQLEHYSMGTLPVGHVAQFEEHFLTCPECQDRLLEMDAWINHVRSVSPRLRAEPRGGWRYRCSKIFASQRSVWAAGLAVGAVLLVAGRPLLNREAPGGPVTVALRSDRGRQDVASGLAPAGRKLVLSIDLTQVAPAASYRLEIVDRRGKQVWDGAISANAGSADTGRLDQPVSKLPAGTYFVRLYGAAELLREYPLSVE